MARRISQDYFNSTVKENMDIFCIGVEEAISETIKGFKSQDVDLTGILTTVEVVEGRNPLVHIADHLNNDQLSSDFKIGQLKDLMKLFSDDKEYQIAAGNYKIYNVILKLTKDSSSPKELILTCLRALASLMDGYPDLLDEEGFNYIMNIMEECRDDEINMKLLEWVQKCCVKHEKNRQIFMEKKISKHLSCFLKSQNMELLKIAFKVLTVLTFDDDVRELISKCHSSTCTLAVDCLEELVRLIDVVSDNEQVLCDLMLTLSVMLVRNEYCAQVMNANGLTYIFDVFSRYPHNKKLQRRVFLVLGALAGNDDVRNRIVKDGAASLITSSLAMHSSSDSVGIPACNALAKICLRNPRNCCELFEIGCVEIVLQFVTTNQTNPKAVAAGCRALRNMVSHNPEIREGLLKLQAEEFLRNYMEKNKESSDVKTLLKDMGCHVELNEPWTGKMGNKLDD